MIYTTYGPAPTSHLRVVRTPDDPLLASPLPRAGTHASLRRHAGAATRTALRIAGIVALALVAVSAAFAVRFAVYAAGHAGGLF